MEVKIKRIDKSLSLPKYETSGAVGFDLMVRKDTIIKAKQLELVPNNVVIETPAGYMLMLSSRSSTPYKKGLMVANGIGVIDIDYSGPDDEIKTLVYNFTDQDVLIKKGDRISQGIFVKVNHGEWMEVEVMENKTRGGFGSTC